MRTRPREHAAPTAPRLRVLSAQPVDSRAAATLVIRRIEPPRAGWIWVGFAAALLLGCVVGVIATRWRLAALWIAGSMALPHPAPPPPSEPVVVATAVPAAATSASEARGTVAPSADIPTVDVEHLPRARGPWLRPTAHPRPSTATRSLD